MKKSWLLLLVLALSACNTGSFSTAKKPVEKSQLGSILASQKEKAAKPLDVQPGANEADDEAICKSKGFPLGEMTDPRTEKHYQCRAELMRSRVSQNESVLNKLTPTQRSNYESWQQKGQNFETKAKEAHRQQVNARRSSRNKWEYEHAEKIRANETKDHKACKAKGFSPGKVENPNTEAYYDCRAVLAAKRVTPPPPETQYDSQQMPKVVLEFYRKAEESRHAFDTRDYQDHLSCLDKGLLPGAWEKPSTAEYYRCRASLAGGGLGTIVKSLFLEDVVHAQKAAEQHQVCTLRHYKPGSPEYKLCRQAYVGFKQCKSKINSKVAAKKSRNHRECTQKSALEYPSSFTRKTAQEVIKVSESGKRTKIKTIEPARFTTQELDKFRSSTTSLCMSDKETDIVQYRLQLEYQCEQIMDNLGQRPQ